MMDNELRKNKFFYKSYIISKQSLFIWTVFLIYLKQKGLSYTEIMMLNSISAVITFILEIPSGILADRFSRRKLLLYGEIFKVLSLIIVLCTNNFFVLIFNAIFSGVGDAVISGSDEALIYDSFLKDGKEEFYKEYISVVQMWAFRFSALATLVAGFLYGINYNLPIILSIILQLIAIIFVFQLKDTNNIIRSNNDIKDELNIQLKNIKFLINNKSIIKLFFVYIIMMIIISNINYTSQTFLPSIGLNYSYIGIIFFFFNIIASFGAKYAAKVNLKSNYIILGYCIILIGLCFSNLYLALVLLSISRFINGMVWPILNSDINKRLDTENRATMLSYKSLLIQLSFIIFDPLVGIALDLIGMRYTYALMGILAFIVLLVVIVFRKYLYNKNKTIIS
ncbi:MFS transporter [Clostridium zeae]|uniref:MFS transporter n=1 Tax=Clostridium zeae TaxID=2759022 RepID=A0ABQ1E8X7_9CLOT|nr:MFS transporter [Clostridium zeae]GFZ31223.1 MFS transporter [Clostridium zeae]